MQPGQILLVVAALACPIGMGVMVWWMSKNMGGDPAHSAPGDSKPVNSAERLAALRTQRQQLEAEISEVSRLAELEARRDALLASARSSKPAQDETDAPAAAGHAS